MKKIVKVLSDVFYFLVATAILLFIAFIGISLSIYIFKWLFVPEPKPTCYFRYVDANGVEGTGTTCKRIYDNIYCGNAEDAHLIVSYERVCE